MKDRSQILALLCLGLFSAWNLFSQPSNPPNFLLITVDTLRLDRLGVYGSTVPGMPNVDAMGRKGVVFERYYATANCTTPSHLSIFSGKLPSTFGIYDNEKYDVTKHHMLADYLRDVGYKSYGITSVFFLSRSWLKGLGNSFDIFHAPENGEWKASEVTSKFKELLPALKKDKFFVWLHFYDPHTPYDPPENYRKLFAVQAGSIDVPDIEGSVDRQWMKSHGLKKTSETRARYRGEVAYTDAQIGEVLRALEENSLDKDTIVIFVADHGELLGSHGYFYTHFTLYEQTIHVPFIVYGKQFRKGRVPEFVSGTDIAPTVLELAGCRKPEDMEGLSAVPFLQQQHPLRKRLIYSQAAHNIALAVFQPPYKLIFNKSTSPYPQTYELYNVIEDPYERRNQIQTMESLAGSILQRSNPYFVDQVNQRPSTLNEEDSEKLKALGYVVH